MVCFLFVFYFLVLYWMPWSSGPELERQRQAVPSRLLTSQPSLLVHSKPVRNPVSKNRVESSSMMEVDGMMPEVDLWLTCSCALVVTCKSTPDMNKHVHMHTQIFKSNPTEIYRSLQYRLLLEEGLLLLIPHVHKMQ